MTREEFRDYVDVLRSQNEISYNVYSELIDGIDTLEQEPCDYYDADNKTCRRSEVPKEPCEDAISRQTVLDDLEKSHITSGVHNQGTWNECIDSMMRTVGSMPSVIPQHTDAEVPKEPILDKIRAEIEEQKHGRCFDDDDMFVYRTGLDDALDIIDKYKAESEVKDDIHRQESI